MRVSFTDDAGNAELLTSEDTDAWSATMTVEWVYQGHGYYSADAKKAGSLSPASFTVDGTTYTVKMVETRGWMYIGTDREIPFDFVLELDGTRFASNDASFRTYSYGNIYKWVRTGLSWRDGDTVEVRLLRAFEDETAVNSAATGAPTISGTVQVGETLTADTSGIADEDGLDNAMFNYQWLADDTEIAGATDSTYTPAEADEGKTVKVRVNFTDDAGNEETLTSAATNPVAQAPTPNNPATGAPTITGTVQVGETLTADTSGIADEDGLDNVSFAYQWLADDTEIAGATDSTYTLVEADESKAIQVRVSFTDNAGNEETLTSQATASVTEAPRPNTPATGAPTISGTAQVGQTLTTNTSGVVDADGLSNVQYEYQWLADGTEIQGAMSSTHTLVEADEGRAIRVQVSFTDDTGNEETLTSAGTAAVTAQPNSPATGAPTISGTAQMGETLTADTSGIADHDGLTNTSFSYQWLADDTEITGATDSTYTMADDDEGKAIKVRVTFTDDAGNDETLTSAATDAVSAAPTPNSPATGAPTISGTAQVGETLTADTSGIADADGLENVSFSYQWLAGDTANSGATGSTYTLADGDEGKAIKVRVSFTDDNGNEEELTSEATETVSFAVQPQIANSPATGAPTISGTAQVGETLTADTSGIADQDGLDNATFTFQWLADHADISGATGSTYTLADADEGKAIRVQISFTDDAGNEETLTSAATEAVAGNEEPVAREDSAAWSATMTVEWVYQGYGYYSTDTKKAGALSPASFNVDGTTYTVKMVETRGWMYIGVDRELPFDFVLELDGVRFASSDASFASYSYGNIYRWEGTGLSWRGEDTVEVRLLRAFQDETPVNSAATGAPTISGTAQMGETLTADTSSISDAGGLTSVSYSYQWIRNDGNSDSAISGATARTYTLADADEGKAIKVKVSFTDDASNKESLTSGATDTVSAAPHSQQSGHGSTHHQRDRPGGRDADSGHQEHRRRGRAGQRRLHLPVVGRRR